MAGIVLCVFFALGVMTGFSEPGRRLAQRFSRFVHGLAVHAAGGAKPAGGALDYFRQAIGPLEEIAGLARPAPMERIAAAAPQGRASGAVALVEKKNGFYTLSAEGTLTGPVSPAGSPDLPVLSGPGVEEADGTGLVRDAAVLVRAEAGLSRLVSEMRVESDGTAALFLDRARMEIVFDPEKEASEIRRVTEVLRRWQGREGLIAKLDLTASGLAVVRLKAGWLRPQPRRAAPMRAARRGPGGNGLADVRVARANR